MQLPSSAVDLYKVKADPHQFLLYEKGAAASDDAPVKGEELAGYHVVGHYTTPETLLNGLRWRLLKQKSKRAATLQEFVERAIGQLQAQRPLLERIVADAVKARS
jgi:hypothetical protein